MKVKTVMKIGIPLLAVSALAIALPVALTAVVIPKKPKIISQLT